MAFSSTSAGVVADAVTTPLRVVDGAVRLVARAGLAAGLLANAWSVGVGRADQRRVGQSSASPGSAALKLGLLHSVDLAQVPYHLRIGLHNRVLRGVSVDQAAVHASSKPLKVDASISSSMRYNTAVGQNRQSDSLQSEPSAPAPLTLWSWALYDWANTAFALVVMTALFPVFFGDFWAADMPDADSTFWFGLAASLSGVLTALAAPFLGIYADLRAKRKTLLLAFTVLGAAASAALALADKGQWALAAALYVLSVFAFATGNLFYDSLLRGLTRRDNRHLISGAGFALGYFGGTLLLVSCLWIIRDPQAFGIEDTTAATRLAFVLTAAWWLLFSLPLAAFVKEPPVDETRKDDGRTLARQALAELRNTLQSACRSQRLRWFLPAYFCYMDGINALGKMALKLGSDLGFERPQLLAALVLAQLTGIPFSLLFGYIGQRTGVRYSLLAGIAIYLGVVIYASQMSSAPIRLAGYEVPPIYLLGMLIGTAQGGMVALSRSFFAGLVPPQREGAFFGLYNIVGKASNILGPTLVAGVAMLTGSTQMGILSLAAFFLLGGLFLLPATKPEGNAD